MAVRVGLLVGVNAYDRLGPLSFSVQDVAALKDVLCDQSRGGFELDHILSLVDGAKLPTKANIIDALELLVSKAGDDDEVLFYFSGHGFEADGRAYLAPLDARTNRAEETAIPIERINEMLRGSKARTKLIFFDSCYSGLEKGKAGSGVMPKSFEDALKEMASKGSGTVILTSCSLGEFSYEDSEFNQSVFTHFLVEGLRGNADLDGDYDITVTEAYQYLKQRIDEYSIRSEKKQTPNLISSMAGDVVLVRVPRPAMSTPIVGSPSVTKVELIKWGSSHYGNKEGNDAQENADYDAVRMSGQLGALLSKIYGPSTIRKVEGGYAFPHGKYSYWSMPDDEEAEDFSAQVELRFDADAPGSDVTSVVSAWKPTFLEIRINQLLDLVKVYESLARNGLQVVSYVPDKLVEVGGFVQMRVENLTVEAVIRLTPTDYDWTQSQITDFGPQALLDLVVGESSLVESQSDNAGKQASRST